MIPLWLDCDTGHDDAFAILLAAHHPNANLLGISTVYGNAPLPQTTYNTLAILKAIGKDVPVYSGASKPFCRKSEYAPEIHGKSGLDGVDLPIPTQQARLGAVHAMYEALSDGGWLIATGCLTNVALLFSVYPDIVNRISLSVMGGGSFGNWTEFAEFNIWLDPESARCVFSNPPRNTALVTLDLTHQFMAREMPGLFGDIVTYFKKTYREVFNMDAPLHDPLAVAIVLEPDLFSDERFEVVIDEEQRGRTIFKPGTVRVPQTLKKDEVWKMITDAWRGTPLAENASIDGQ